MDSLKLADRTLQSRLILGSARYPNPEIMLEALRASGTEMVTVAIRRVNLKDTSGESLVQLLRGEKYFKITVVDDATIDGKFGSASYDDEGVPHRRNTLVENGVLKGFIYDLKTAGQAGVESTGNGSRGLFYPPDPSFTNIVLQPGQTPLKEIIASIDEGILVESLLGLGQGNIISGAFSNPLALAFKIEKGEIVGRVKDLSIAGNIYDLLKDVAAVSQEAQWVFNSFYAPYILIPEMNVAGKS